MPPKRTRKPAQPQAPEVQEVAPYKPMFRRLVQTHLQAPADGEPDEDDETNTDEPQAAFSEDVATLLTRKTQEKEDKFLEESIIAERIHKGEENVKEHLIIALPEWRRFGFKFGCDKVHLAAWEAFKESNQTIELENEDYDPIIIHPYHPILDKYNNVKGLFEHLGGGEDFDNRDRQEAREMLGHMLKHVVDLEATGGYIEDDVVQMLHTGVFSDILNDHPEPYDPEEAIECAQKFLDVSDITQRGQLGRSLLTHTIVEDEDWVSALAIALLTPQEMLERMERLRTSQNTDEKRRKRYREMTTKFLTQYHTEHKANGSFVYVLHIFYTLIRILREQNHKGMEADAHEGDNGGGSGGDGQNEAHDENGHVDDGSGDKETQREGAREKDPGTQTTARKGKARPQRNSGGGRPAQRTKKRAAPPADGTRRSKRAQKEDAENEGL
ncbi:Nn.00g021250.m01.CDS01 [Neocucurbitaria sp. VM-36]